METTKQQEIYEKSCKINSQCEDIRRIIKSKSNKKEESNSSSTASEKKKVTA